MRSRLLDVWPPPPDLPPPAAPPRPRRPSVGRWAVRILSGPLLCTASAQAAYDGAEGVGPTAVAVWGILALLSAVILLLSWRRD